jgi:general secretion pathway protein E
MQNQTTPTPEPLPDERLAKLLIERGKLGGLDLARVARLREEQGGREPLARLVVRLGMLSEHDAAAALSELHGVPLARKEDYPERALPEVKLALRFLKETLAVPIAEDARGVVLAMADPQNDEVASAFEVACGRPVVRRVGVPSEIDAAIERLYGSGKSRMARILEQADSANEGVRAEDVEQLRDSASEAPAIRLVTLVMQRAVEAGASDVHLEPFAATLKIRYRIDGVLQEAEAPPAQLAPAVISRIKLMARLDIAERRLPQDGRMSLRVQGKELDVRVSTVPTLHGESVVLRLLNQETVSHELTALGFAAAELERFRAVLDQPHGMLLVTGPTGSGKTTTLYTALSRLNTPERKIITVEDPVEYQLEGINQIQVKPSINLAFATALRSIVRQDPDVIMVGEMRDLETARICVQSALTGHLVLSTLHTNDAPSSVTRLLEMGIEDYLVTSTVNAVIGQRLVRMLCRHCRAPYEAPEEVLQKTGLAKLAQGGRSVLYRAVGCPQCSQTGYRGRTAVLELMTMSEPIRRLVLRHAQASELREAARSLGMQTMYEHGLAKALAGTTSLEEVLRVAYEA